MQDQLDEFKEHAEIVKKFGRDPRRNKILERENTTKEEEYLVELKEQEAENGLTIDLV